MDIGCSLQHWISYLNEKNHKIELDTLINVYGQILTAYNKVIIPNPKYHVNIKLENIFITKFKEVNNIQLPE